MTTYQMPASFLAALTLLCGGFACDDDTAATSDTVDPAACQDPQWTPGACVAGTTFETPATTTDHVPEPDPITYVDNPPASGLHRPVWARWGEFSYLAPEWYIHNLEHGGIAVLYHPCTDAASLTALRNLLDARQDDDGGPFRYVMTPYPDLPTGISVLAWEWTYAAECVKPDEITTFIDAHYRMAREDVAGDGPFIDGWMQR